MTDALFASIGLVALAEIGDKTQLLSLLLATKYRRPAPIVAGILVATLANHAAAGALGTWLTTVMSPGTLRWIVGLGFFAMAAWMLVPDAIDASAAPSASRLGVFGATAIAFFVAEIGDKTQVATIALAARYAEFGAVVVGTTAGMMLANVPVVLAGHRLAARVPIHRVHAGVAILFAAIGVAVLVGGAQG